MVRGTTESPSKLNTAGTRVLKVLSPAFQFKVPLDLWQKQYTSALRTLSESQTSRDRSMLNIGSKFWSNIFVG